MTISKYITIDTTRKAAGFNAPITARARRYLDRFRYGSRIPIWAMDAADAGTSAFMRNAGLKNPLTAFTHSASDYSRIPVRKLRIRKRQVEASCLYTQLDRRRGHIVIDDGFTTGRNTIGRIESLIRRGLRHFALACNLSPRCKGGSHWRFMQDVIREGRRMGYSVEAERLPAYTQYDAGKGPYMWPFWFEFNREKK